MSPPLLFFPLFPRFALSFVLGRALPSCLMIAVPPLPLFLCHPGGFFASHATAVWWPVGTTQHRTRAATGLLAAKLDTTHKHTFFGERRSRGSLSRITLCPLSPSTTHTYTRAHTRMYALLLPACNQPALFSPDCGWARPLRLGVAPGRLRLQSVTASGTRCMRRRGGLARAPHTGMIRPLQPTTAGTCFPWPRCCQRSDTRRRRERGARTNQKIERVVRSHPAFSLAAGHLALSKSPGRWATSTASSKSGGPRPLRAKSRAWRVPGQQEQQQRQHPPWHLTAAAMGPRCRPTTASPACRPSR